MSGDVVLDTSVVVDYLQERDQELIWRFKEVTELYLPLTLEDVRRFTGVCTLIAPDETTAGFYGQIKADLAQAGYANSAKRYLDCSFGSSVPASSRYT